MYKATFMKELSILLKTNVSIKKKKIYTFFNLEQNVNVFTNLPYVSKVFII